MYSFCSYHELQIWYYEDRSKKNGGSSENIAYYTNEKTLLQVVSGQY
jgi:hypothetical protein